MTTTLSSKGQIVVPRSVRTKLGLQPGTKFDVSTDGDKLVLKPKLTRSAVRLRRDRKTGLPTFVVPPQMPPITSDYVRAALLEFP